MFPHFNIGLQHVFARRAQDQREPDGGDAEAKCREGTPRGAQWYGGPGEYGSREVKHALRVALSCTCVYLNEADVYNLYAP